MSAATARPLAATAASRPASAARLAVVGVVAGAVALGVALLVASLVPSESLAGRLLGAAGEQRAGPFTQELSANLDQRLRLAGGLLLALGAGLALTRGALEDLASDAWSRIDVRLDRVSVWVVVVATGLALTVRLAFLGQPMRYDEALTFNEFASRPLYYGLSFYPDPNNHLLNTLLMHLAYATFGNQPWALRLPAFLAGVLLVPATFWLARLLYGARAAAVAAALVAASSYLVEYSTNARGYTQQTLCFVVMLGLVLLAVRRPSRAALLLAVLLAVLGAYALPTMLYGVAVAAAFVLLSLRTSPTRHDPASGVDTRHLAASGLLLGLLVTLVYLPVLLVSGPDKLVANRFVVPLGLDELPAELARSLGQTWALWNRDVPLPLAAALLVGFAIATVDELRAGRVPLGVLAPAVSLLLVLLQRVAPFERVWLFLLPLYFAIAARGLARFVDGRWLGLVFGAVLGYTTLTSGSILRSTETGAFPDAEAVVRSLAPRLAPDDAVMTLLPASLPELQYYFPRYGLPTAVLVRPPEEGQNLWVIAPSGSPPPHLAGWPRVSEVADFADSALFELKRS